MTTNIPANPVELVRLFNTTGKQIVRDEPVFNVPERQMRFALIKEEIEELVEKGLDIDDIVETIDACADIVYVVCGAALTHGIGMEVRRGTSIYSIDFYDDSQMRKAYAEEFRRLLLSLFRANTVEALVPVWEDIVEMCYLVSSSYGVDLDAAIAEVQASNMSKFGPNGEVYLREDGKIMKGPDYFRPDLERVLREQGVQIPEPETV